MGAALCMKGDSRRDYPAGCDFCWPLNTAVASRSCAVNTAHSDEVFLKKQYLLWQFCMHGVCIICQQAAAVEDLAHRLIKHGA